MTERSTAGEQLGRILYLLPLASREEGVSVAEAASALGVSAATLQADIAAVTARDFYFPPGSASDIQISIEADVVRCFGENRFTRPTKLSRREALAVSLALRAATREAEADRRAGIMELARRIDSELAAASTEDIAKGFAFDEIDGPGAGLREALREAARARRTCRIRYLKPTDPDPSERRVDPYQVVYARGGWYLIGHCHLRGTERVFRLDRVLEAVMTESGFEPPVGFDPAHYLGGGRVFYSTETCEVKIRYSPKVAPWVREIGPCEELDGGAVAVTYSGADPGWAVRHTLLFGAEAEVLHPEAVRDLVVGTVESILQGERPPDRG